jgi:hypothetical protein
MNRKRMFPLAFIAGVSAMIFLLPEKLSAQLPDEDLTVVVTSASGTERYLESYSHVLDRAGLGPNQTVALTLQFSSGHKGKPVMVSALDGGGLAASNGMENLLVGEDGTVALSFQAGAAPGLYRLLVQLGVNAYRLEFYVLDLVHPQDNPPRLQIVN